MVLFVGIYTGSEYPESLTPFYCPSVRESVHPSVRPSVSVSQNLLVGPAGRTSTGRTSWPNQHWPNQLAEPALAGPASWINSRFLRLSSRNSIWSRRSKGQDAKQNKDCQCCQGSITWQEKSEVQLTPGMSLQTKSGSAKCSSDCPSLFRVVPSDPQGSPCQGATKC